MTSEPRGADGPADVQGSADAVGPGGAVVPDDGVRATSSGSGRRAPGRGRNCGRRALLALPALAWVVGTSASGIAVLASTWNLYGEPPTAGQLRAEDTALIWTGVFAFGGPLVGLLLSVWLRSRRAAVVYLVGLLVVLGAWLNGVGREDPPPPASPTSGTGGCQVNSGGGNRCPGN